jgi:hypothetical protein
VSDVINAVIWDAKINAINGKYEQAFDDVLACYRCGFQRCDSPCLMFHQLTNLGLQSEAIRTASLIMKKTQIPDSLLNSFQQQLKQYLINILLLLILLLKKYCFMMWFKGLMYINRMNQVCWHGKRNRNFTPYAMITHGHY